MLMPYTIHSILLSHAFRCNKYTCMRIRWTRWICAIQHKLKEVNCPSFKIEQQQKGSHTNAECIFLLFELNPLAIVSTNVRKIIIFHDANWLRNRFTKEDPALLFNQLSACPPIFYFYLATRVNDDWSKLIGMCWSSYNLSDAQSQTNNNNVWKQLLPIVLNTCRWKAICFA